MKRLVVFTGAGVSAESGIRTFRDSDGLWEQYAIEDVATPDAWRKDRNLVLDFYNQRRLQVMEAQPNPAHLALVELEKHFMVSIITQNVDDLHERAGSSDVLHLHGEIRKSRSTLDPRLIYEINGPLLNPGDLCEKGSQLRPHIVWFGESVPAMDAAIQICEKAELFMIIGTSLEVYPASSLLHYFPDQATGFFVDPKPNLSGISSAITVIASTAGEGVPMLAEKLIKDYVL